MTVIKNKDEVCFYTILPIRQVAKYKRIWYTEFGKKAKCSFYLLGGYCDA